MAFALLELTLPQRCCFLVCFTLLCLSHEWMLLLLLALLLPLWPCPSDVCPRPGIVGSVGTSCPPVVLGKVPCQHQGPSQSCLDLVLAC